MSDKIDQIADLITEDPDVVNELLDWLKTKFGRRPQPQLPAVQIQELRMALSQIRQDAALQKAFVQGAINVQRQGWKIVPRAGKFGGMTGPLWALLRKYIGDRVINSIADRSVRLTDLDTQLKAEQAKEARTTKRIEQPK